MIHPFRWNAARAFASYLDMNVDLYHGRSVLELGAGGGLPGIVAAKNGAQQVGLYNIKRVAYQQLSIIY